MSSIDPKPKPSIRFIASLLTIGVIGAMAGLARAESSREMENRLRAGFLNPPDAAKPRVYWHWVDGNVTEAGIKLDLEWMKRVGIGGVINFDVGFAAWGPPFVSPAWVSRPIVYPGADWQRAKRLTAELTDRLGMEFAVASSEGWTQTGGPWVTPAQSMKKLVWSETAVTGGRPFTGRLPAPPQTTGPFQNIRLFELGKSSGEPPVYYRDVATVAYPAPTSEISPASLHPTVTSSAGAIEAARLWDGDLATPVSLPFGDGPRAWIQFSFAQPQRIQACTAVLGPLWFGFNPLIEQREASWLEASDDGVRFRKVVDLPERGAPEQTVAFAPVTARRFRIVMERPEPSALEKAGLAPKTVDHRITELELLPAARVNRFEDKAGYSTFQITEREDTPAVSPADTVRPQDIVDLTGRVRPDGSLDWTPPPGRWIVLRFGYSLMGHVNHPASAGGTGLEVDELNSAAMKAYADNYLAQFQIALGKDRMGAHGLQNVETDSAESGGQNWTDDMPAQFRRSRGYNLITWLPVLAGRVVAGSSASDRFLWDFRQTLGELMASGHYGQLAASLHRRGMGLYSESHESGRALTADGMAVKRPADIPMGAIWAAARSINPPENYDADLEESAAVAHIYGKPLVAAEAFTAAGNPYGFDPENLRPFADRAMALGVNRFVIHSSAEQPDNRPGPGVGLGPYGTFFNRHETWAEQAAGWVSYLTRSSYLLQQGRFTADIAYLYGEDTNLTSLFHASAPAIPRGYAFDFVNAEALRQEFSVQGGRLVTRSGSRYRVLVLDGSTRRMSLPVLRKLQSLAQAGAWIVGAEPSGTPSLADNESDTRSLVAQLWGTGRIAPQEALGRALREKGIEPEVDFGAAPNFEWRFVHRALAQGELYFISNASSQAQAVEASFRVNGRLPERWSADSGAVTPLTYRVSHGRTVVPLTLAAQEACFVMFLRPTAEQSRVVAQPQARDLASLTGPWTVNFPSALGGAGALTLEKLRSWTEVNDPAVKYFSGTAVYRQTLEIRPEWLSGQSRLRLDLGEVKNLAEVLVNGRSVGVLWHAPFEADLTAALVPGPNRLEVKVTNLWPNRLIGDKQPGAAQTVFATFAPFKADSPLLPSGLLGPVRLLQNDN